MVQASSPTYLVDVSTTQSSQITMKSVSRTAGSALRRVARPIRTQAPRNCLTPSAVALPRSNAAPVAATRAFHLSTSFRGILPDVENPKPKESEPSERPTVPTDITTEEFHERADEFIDDLVTRLEAQQETRSDLEIEHSVSFIGVVVFTNRSLTMTAGWRSGRFTCECRNLRNQQATKQQANLAQLSHIRTEKIRLGGSRGRIGPEGG